MACLSEPVRKNCDPIEECISKKATIWVPVTRPGIQLYVIDILDRIPEHRFSSVAEW